MAIPLLCFDFTLCVIIWIGLDRILRIVLLNRYDRIHKKVYLSFIVATSNIYGFTLIYFAYESTIAAPDAKLLCDIVSLLNGDTPRKISMYSQLVVCGSCVLAYLIFWILLKSKHGSKFDDLTTKLVARSVSVIVAVVLICWVLTTLIVTIAEMYLSFFDFVVLIFYIGNIINISCSSNFFILYALKRYFVMVYLSAEYWRSVFHCLSVEDLDSCELVGHQFHLLRAQFFREVPLRHLYGLFVRNKTFLLAQKCPAAHSPTDWGIDHPHNPMLCPKYENPRLLAQWKYRIDDSTELAKRLSDSNVRIKYVDWYYCQSGQQNNYALSQCAINLLNKCKSAINGCVLTVGDAHWHRMPVFGDFMNNVVPYCSTLNVAIRIPGRLLVTDANGCKETITNLFHLAAFGSGSVCRRIYIRASIHFGNEQTYQGLVKWLHSDPSQYSPKYLFLCNIKQAIDCDRIVSLIRQAFEDPSGGSTRKANEHAGNQICSFSLRISKAIGNTFLLPTLGSFTLTNPKTGEKLSCTMDEGVTSITRSFQKNIDPMFLKGRCSLKWEAQYQLYA